MAPIALPPKAKPPFRRSEYLGFIAPLIITISLLIAYIGASDRSQCCMGNVTYYEVAYCGLVIAAIINISSLGYTHAHRAAYFKNSNRTIAITAKIGYAISILLLLPSILILIGAITHLFPIHA